MRKSVLILIVTTLTACSFTQSQDITMKTKQDSDSIYTVVKTEEEWKEMLTPSQYYITRMKGTERPFTGKYYDFYEKGHYDCVACGSLLFDSDTKFVSGCGWPSFFDITSQKSIRILRDTSHNMIRSEVTCAICGAHLGHVFEDGPPPTGLRYCINSEALHFIPEKGKKSEE